MKIILAGHEGSKKILTASSFLIEKYIPKGFTISFLNFGSFDGWLFAGCYENLGKHQEGGALSWSKYVRQYLKRSIASDFVIFGLDDYLLSAPMNRDSYNQIFRAMVDDPEIVSGRLCHSDFYKPHERFVRPDGLIELTKDAEYSCTTQYSIWRREALIDILGQVLDPWSFEITGSGILNGSGGRVIGSKIPALVYPEWSCLSSKWTGVRVRENVAADVDALVGMGYLNREELC